VQANVFVDALQYDLDECHYDKLREACLAKHGAERYEHGRGAKVSNQQAKF
jgi:hypothetical protein